MTIKLTADEVITRVASGLDEAEWRYDEDADEMEIVLAGGHGREGRSILIDDDTFLRVDPETNQPLSIIVTAWTYWSARQAAAPVPSLMPATPQAWLSLPEQMARQAVERTVRTSQELAAAVP